MLKSVQSRGSFSQLSLILTNQINQMWRRKFECQDKHSITCADMSWTLKEHSSAQHVCILIPEFFKNLSVVPTHYWFVWTCHEHHHRPCLSEPFWQLKGCQQWWTLPMTRVCVHSLSLYYSSSNTWSAGQLIYYNPDTNQTVVYNGGDISWTMTSTALVWLMVPGIGFFYCGLLRRKNALSMIYLSMGTIAVVSFQVSASSVTRQFVTNITVVPLGIFPYF